MVLIRDELNSNQFSRLRDSYLKDITLSDGQELDVEFFFMQKPYTTSDLMNKVREILISFSTIETL